LYVYDQEKLYNLELKISLENNISIYDSLFLALSLKEDMILVTRDKKQKEVAEKLKIRVILEE